MSTQNAIAQLITKIQLLLNLGEIKPLGVSLDLAALDAVSHGKLLNTLEDIGRRRLPLTLFRSYLTDRIQHVKIGNIVSEEIRVEYGIPQGIVIGPVLFILHINDILTKNNNRKHYLQADDTVIIYIDKS